MQCEYKEKAFTYSQIEAAKELAMLYNLGRSSAIGVRKRRKAMNDIVAFFYQTTAKDNAAYGLHINTLSP